MFALKSNTQSKLSRKWTIQIISLESATHFLTSEWQQHTRTNNIQFIHSFSFQLYLNTHTGAQNFNLIIYGFIYMEFRHSFTPESLNSLVNNASTERERKKIEIEMSQNWVSNSVVINKTHTRIESMNLLHFFSLYFFSIALSPESDAILRGNRFTFQLDSHTQFFFGSALNLMQKKFSSNIHTHTIHTM